MLRDLRPTLVLLAALAVLTGLVYPLLTWQAARLLFPARASGSLILRDGRIIGSRLIGQEFTLAGYFHSRPSALDPAYGAQDSGASNLGPTSRRLMAEITARLQALSGENPAMASEPAPVDLVTSSASGLDPDIAPADALYQVPRIAASRHIPETELTALIDRMTRGRTLGFMGEPRLNVLALNLALDALAAAHPSR